MKSNKTREKILDASLKLFNEKKASNVSTVQISTAMKISPGNLYYYFANKEEVIRCIWEERMLDETDQLFARPEKIDDMAMLLDFLDECFGYYEKYSFFYSELPTLFTNDEQLIELYHNVKKSRVKALTEFFDRWIRQGNMIEISDARRTLLADNFLALLQTSISHYDLKEAKERGFAYFAKTAALHILSLVEPYFTEPVKSQMKQELQKRDMMAEES